MDCSAMLPQRRESGIGAWLGSSGKARLEMHCEDGLIRVIDTCKVAVQAVTYLDESAYALLAFCDTARTLSQVQEFCLTGVKTINSSELAERIEDMKSRGLLLELDGCLLTLVVIRQLASDNTPVVPVTFKECRR